MSTVTAPAATSSSSPSTLPRLDTSEGKDTSRGHNDAQGLWAAVDLSEEEEWDLDSAGLLEYQKAWRRAIEYDFPPGGDITCDPRTFIPLERSALMSVGVAGPNADLSQSPDPALLRKALTRAGERILSVTDHGEELTPKQLDELYESGDFEDGGYTPAYVSDPESYTGVVGITNIDTESMHFIWLQRTALRIVAEEIRKVGATPARIVPYLDSDTLAALRESGVQLPTEDELR